MIERYGLSAMVLRPTFFFQAVARRQLFEHVRPEAFLELGDASQHGCARHAEPTREFCGAHRSGALR
jgi:hypothetical protein